MWQIIRYGRFGVRKRWIFWALIPATTLPTLINGFKDR